MDTTPVNRRFTNSTMGWNSNSATNWSCSQVGQSEQPRPDPVSRTAAPLTTMVARARSANMVIRW